MAKCEICGRERLNGLARPGDTGAICDTASAFGYESPRCYRLGYERENAWAEALRTTLSDYVKAHEAGLITRDLLAPAKAALTGTASPRSS